MLLKLFIRTVITFFLPFKILSLSGSLKTFNRFDVTNNAALPELSWKGMNLKGGLLKR